MDRKYKKWIDENYPTGLSCLGKCFQATEKMKEAFPELIRTNGFVHIPGLDEPRIHWWMKDSNGFVIDPTAFQYPYYAGASISSYEEFEDDHPARKHPRLKCMNCGEYFYASPELNGIMHNEKCNREVFDDWETLQVNTKST